MIQLYNKDIRKIAGLVDYKDLHIESILESGDKTLSFSYPKKSKFYDEIIEEAYIRTKDNEYVIKEKNLTGTYTTFICKLNVEDIEGQPFDRFESVEQTIENTLNLALVSTGWVVGTCDIKKKRTVRKTNCSAWDIIQEIKKTFRVDLVFNTLSKSIDIYESLGEDKGTYFIDSLNLKSLQVQGNSYDYATRIIPIGKDGLNIKSINGGKEYVENYQYSNKIKTIYWKDDRYTIAENLKLDAEAKLKAISKPYRSYIASVLNLAKMNAKYKEILDYNLGDAITLVSKDNKVKEKQRIIKIIEYPDNRYKDTVELANATLKFEDVQKEFQSATDTVNNITTDNGTINGETIDSIKVSKIENLEAEILKVTNLKVLNADIMHLKVNKADVQTLNVIEAKVGQIEITKATITQLNAINSKLEHAIIGKADVTELNAAAGRINVLESKAASIDNILAGNINAGNIATGTITAGSGIIADGAIGSAQISSLDVNKLNAGSIDTSKIQLIGPQGRLRIIGNKLQVLDTKDNKLFERIMLGVDDSNNSCLVLRGTDGKTVLLNQDGLTKEGLTEGFGKVTDNSLDANKFDKNSIVRQVNGATETVKGTKVQIGDRTLDVELSTQQNTITEHGKELSTQKASILALDDSIKLKVDNQIFKETTSKINSSITIVKDEANKHTNDLVNKLKADSEKYANEVATAKAQLATEQVKAYADGKVTIEEKTRIKQAEDNLNSAISKANEAEHKAKAHADQVAEQKRDEALSAANVYTNAQITTTNSNLSKATSEINILKGQLSTKVGQNDIDRSISNIKYGGRNLLLDTKNMSPSKWRRSEIVDGTLKYEGCAIQIQTRDWFYSSQYYKYIPGKVYTISCMCKADKVGAVIFASPQINHICGKNLNVPTEWTKFAYTFTATENQFLNNGATEQGLRFECNSLTGKSNKVYITQIKLEEGNVVTDWTPAPEDLDQDIMDNAKIVTDKITTVETELKQTKESFGLSVKDLNSKTSTIETTITNTTNNLTNKINTAKTDAINSALNSARNEINTAKSYAEKVAKDNANLAQSNAINTASTDATKKANDAKSQAINSSNSYTNTAKQQAIDTANSHANSIAETKKNEAVNIATSKITARTIYAKGTGNDFSSNAVVKIGENILTNGHGRGLQVVALDPMSLNQTFKQDYDTYGGGTNTTNFVNKINELNDGNFIIIITSTDAATLSNPDVCNSLYKIGGYAPKSSIESYREAYALIGKSKLGKSNGIEMYIPKTLIDKRAAEVSVNVDEYGVFLGLNSLGIGTDLDNAIIDSTKKVNVVKEEVKKYSDEVATAKAQLAIEQVKSYADGKVTIEEQARIKQAQDNLNSAIGRVNQAKTEAIAAADKASTDKVNLAKAYADDVANKKAELAKQQAIANSDGKISEEEKKRIKQATDNLNTAIAKASTAETNARNYAAQIAEQKKNEANGYTNTQISTVNSKVSNVQSSLNVLKNEINTKVSQSDIDKTVNNIQIGGRNYAKGTSYEWRTINGENRENQCINWGEITQSDLLNKDITISFEYEVSSGAKGQFWLQTSGNYWVRASDEFNVASQPSDKPYRTMKISIPPDKFINVIAVRMDYFVGQLRYRKFKVESGTKPTDWTPAPEDINQEIQDNITTVTEKIKTAESTFTQKTNSISQKVTQVESTTNSLNGKITSNTNRISTAESKLTPTSIIDSVNSSIGSGGVIIGSSTILERDKFTVKDGDNSRIEMQSGAITAYNNSGKKTYYLDDGEVGICAKDNSDSLGMITSVYKSSASNDTLGNNQSYTTPNGRGFKGVGLLAGDYAGYLTLGYDSVWGVDDKYLEFFRCHKSGWMHMGTELNFSNEYGIRNIKEINRGNIAELYLNKIQIQSNAINTNNTTDNNLWLNNGLGYDCWAGKHGDTAVRIGNGYGNGTHGQLVCQNLYVHGSKNRIVDCGDLGFIGMEAYETATPYFGDIGHGKTNNDGDCYIMFDREFMEVCNTDIEYMVIVQDEGGTKDSWAKPVQKRINGFLVKGSPNTSFSFEVKAIQRGFEQNRFKKINEKRSEKTNYKVNDNVLSLTSKNQINKDDSIMNDLELMRGFSYKRVINQVDNSSKNKSLEIINYMEGANLYG